MTTMPARGMRPKAWATRGAVASVAAALTTREATGASIHRRPVRSLRARGTPQARIPATAATERRNPTSWSHAGFQSSMPKAAVPSALRPSYSDEVASAVCSSVHIAAARTALAGKPAAATNVHTAATASRLRQRWP